jgi:hypothetical protein
LLDLSHDKSEKGQARWNVSIRKIELDIEFISIGAVNACMKEYSSSRIILKGNVVFKEMEYDNEKELEMLAVQNKYALFGNNIIYFDIKQIITSNARISKIPDGMFIELLDYNTSRLWIVEYELSHHDLEGHVMPQIWGFINALRNEVAKKAIKERMYNMIKKDPSAVAKIKSILPADGEIYHCLEQIVDRKFGIVIVVDQKDLVLEEVAYSVSTSTKSQSQVLEFITFQNDKQERIHILDTMERVKQQFKQVQLASSTHSATVKTENDWDSRVSRASPQTKQILEEFIATIKNEFSCVAGPWYNWYAFHIGEPKQRKTMFAALIPGKNSATLCFRVDSDDFREDDQRIRTVKGFFFPTGTERRISITEDNRKQLMRYVQHAYKVTQNQRK